MAAQKPINSFIFLDFETGGLDCKVNAVTQIALVAIKGDTLERIDLMNCYIKPYGNYTYEAEALKHTGITMHEIESGIDINEAVDEVLSILKKSDLTPRNKGSKPILVAYNSAFDKGFLVQIFVHTKKMAELEKVCYGHTDFYNNWQPEMLDAVHFTKAAFGADPDIQNFKLATCMEKAGIPLNDAHNALQDTLGLKDMVVGFFGKLRSTGAGIAAAAMPGESIRKHFQF